MVVVEFVSGVWLDDEGELVELLGYPLLGLVDWAPELVEGEVLLVGACELDDADEPV